MRWYCIFHISDFDGEASAAIVKKYCTENNIPLVLKGATYSFSFPFDTVHKTDQLIMCDLSFTPTVMKTVIDYYPNIIWIDHHQIIHKIENADKIPGTRDENYSGCELTWMYFYPELPMPRIISLLGRYDVWDKNTIWDSEILPFQYGLKLYKTDPILYFGIWSKLMEADSTDAIEKIIEQGMVVVKYNKTEYEKNMQFNAFACEICGYNALVVNSSFRTSLLFESLDISKFDILFAFSLVKGEYYTASVYTVQDYVDCSKFCEAFGGGGHIQAAGFTFKDFCITEKNGKKSMTIET